MKKRARWTRELRGRRSETFEGGMRVPAYVIWPGRIEGGTATAEMCMSIDLFPTVLGALGITLPGDRVIDGRDISAALAGQARSPHDHLYYLTAMSGEFQAVRNREYKYWMPISEGWLPVESASAEMSQQPARRAR